MAKDVIPPRLIELVELWAGPAKWHCLYAHFEDMQKWSRAMNATAMHRLHHIRNPSIRAGRRSIHKKQIAELDIYYMQEKQTFELYERLYQELRREYGEIGQLVRTHAPDCLGRIPIIDLANPPGRAGEIALAQSMTGLLGELLSRVTKKIGRNQNEEMRIRVLELRGNKAKWRVVYETINREFHTDYEYSRSGTLHKLIGTALDRRKIQNNAF